MFILPKSLITSSLRCLPSHELKRYIVCENKSFLREATNILHERCFTCLEDNPRAVEGGLGRFLTNGGCEYAFIFGSLVQDGWGDWVKSVRKAHAQRSLQPKTDTVLFPTPTSLIVNESVEHWRIRRYKEGKRACGPSLIVAIKLEQNVPNTALLNPRWVETFMGLPIGWVMLSCVSPRGICL